jgi:hypothetical protein
MTTSRSLFALLTLSGCGVAPQPAYEGTCEQTETAERAPESPHVVILGEETCVVRTDLPCCSYYIQIGVENHGSLGFWRGKTTMTFAVESPEGPSRDFEAKIDARVIEPGERRYLETDELVLEGFMTAFKVEIKTSLHSETNFEVTDSAEISIPLAGTHCVP